MFQTLRLQKFVISCTTEALASQSKIDKTVLMSRHVRSTVEQLLELIFYKKESLNLTENFKHL